MGGRRWTDEENRLLEKYWGFATMKTICEKLNRSERSIKMQVFRLELGAATSNFDGLSLYQLAQVINYNYRSVMEWERHHGLPSMKKRLVSQKPKSMIRVADFWKWAHTNRKRIDFSRFDKGALGPEPDWVAEARKYDQRYRVRFKNRNTPWTEEEDKLLISMVKAYCYTYIDIQKRLLRPETAIKTRLEKLGVQFRPVSAYPHYPEDTMAPRPQRAWSEEDKQKLVDMTESQKYTLVDISRELDRTIKALQTQIRNRKLKTPPPYLGYTLEEEQKIKEMVEQGYSVSTIAVELDKGQMAIHSKIRYMKEANQIAELQEV